MFKLLNPFIFYTAAVTSFMMLLAFKPQPKIFQTTNGKISFSSEAPLELIKAHSDELLGLIDADKKNFSFKVRIRSFEGFNGKTQQGHFNENYMQSEKYPEASFKGKIIEDADFTKDGSYTVRAKGILNVHGVDQERIIRSDVTVKDSKVSINSNFSILLSDHNIPIPKVVYQKLANEIKVEINATLQPR
jgi:hypothetical protein